MLTTQQRHEQIAQLRARIGLIRQREKVRRHKLHTRRLILLGTIIEDMMEVDEGLARSIRRLAGRKLTRTLDRAALGLPRRRRPRDETNRT